MKKFSSIVLVLLLLFSCSHQTEPSQQKEIAVSSESIENKDTTSSANISIYLDSIQQLPTANVPFNDTAYFDFPEEQNGLDSNWINTLELVKIFPNEMKSVEKIWLINRILLSDMFWTLRIGFYASENEFYSALINYNDHLKIIDFVYVAYDEMAEGCFRTKSIISATSVKVFDIDYCYKESVDTILYNIHPNGKFELRNE
ncbi:MAG: hypothetical protein ACWA41_06820 [Putridiphycobacter sp.]